MVVVVILIYLLSLNYRFIEGGSLQTSYDSNNLGYGNEWKMVHNLPKGQVIYQADCNCITIGSTLFTVNIRENMNGSLWKSVFRANINCQGVNKKTSIMFPLLSRPVLKQNQEYLMQLFSTKANVRYTKNLNFTGATLATNGIFTIYEGKGCSAPGVCDIPARNWNGGLYYRDETPPPTKHPTTFPSKNPTLNPTINPTTKRPTLSPSPNPTPPPTRNPVKPKPHNPILKTLGYDDRFFGSSMTATDETLVFGTLGALITCVGFGCCMLVYLGWRTKVINERMKSLEMYAQNVAATAEQQVVATPVMNPLMTTMSSMNQLNQMRSMNALQSMNAAAMQKQMSAGMMRSF